MPVINQVAAADTYEATAAVIQGVYRPKGGWFSVGQAAAFVQLQYALPGTRTGYGNAEWKDEELVGAGAFGFIPADAIGIRFRNAATGSVAIVTASLSQGPEPALAIVALGNVQATVVANPVPLAGAEVNPPTVDNAFHGFTSATSPHVGFAISSFIPGVIGGTAPVYTQFRIVSVLRVTAVGAATSITLSFAATTFPGVHEFSTSIPVPLAAGEHVLDSGWVGIGSIGSVSESLEFVYEVGFTGGAPTCDWLQFGCWIQGG